MERLDDKLHFASRDSAVFHVKRAEQCRSGDGVGLHRDGRRLQEAAMGSSLELPVLCHAPGPGPGVSNRDYGRGDRHSV